MTIIGVAGAIGSGKNFTQLKHGLNYVEERQKQLVTNFPINIKSLHKYACMQKLGIIGAFVYELKKLKYAIHLNLHWAIPLIFRKKPKKPKTKPHLSWGVVRKVKVKPPYFKNMSEQEIAAFIERYV